jgi:hypothetical protein
MPSKSRIHAPGALHHAIRRGIARQKIFLCDEDRELFSARLAAFMSENKTSW